MNNRLRKTHLPFLIALAAVVISVLCLPSSALAGIHIYQSQQILDSHTFESGGNLFFQDNDGQLHEFVTDINDPVIRNKGEGAFYTVSEQDVINAINSVRFPLEDIQIDVFLLPYPRRNILVSSAGKTSIYLSPGVVPYEEIQVHALIAHEIGHLVHNQIMPDSDRSAWSAFRRLRGITDTGTYHHNAAHKNRPHEVFAEDFRFLFGGTLANYSGGIENPDLPLPNTIPGLKSFYLALAGKGSQIHGLPIAGRLNVFPNPTQAGVSITFSEGSRIDGVPTTMQVFDVGGRLVHQAAVTNRNAIRWSGYVREGSKAAPGLYFVKVHNSRDQWVGKVIVSR